LSPHENHRPGRVDIDDSIRQPLHVDSIPEKQIRFAAKPPNAAAPLSQTADDGGVIDVD